MSRLQYQRRFLQILAGIVAGSPQMTISYGTLALAAARMRDETLRNARLFPGIEDSAAQVLSNTSGEGGPMPDGVKLAGVRIGLDVICGEGNRRCEMQQNNPGSPELNSNGNYQYIGNENYPTLTALLSGEKISAKLSGLTGGIQRGEGLTGKFACSPDSLVARVFEGFAGSHDFIGAHLPGFYDELENTSRNRTPWLRLRRKFVWLRAGKGAFLSLSRAVLMEVQPKSGRIPAAILCR